MIPDAGKLPKNLSPGFETEEIGDVLQKHPARSYQANDFKRFGPLVFLWMDAREVRVSNSRKVLTREARRDNINQALIAFGVPSINEKSDVGEDGGFVENPVDDALSNERLTERIDLNVTEGFPAEELRSVDPAPGSREK